MEIYEPFLSDGFVSLNSDFAQSTPITILRNTGASQSLILADTLPFSEKSSSVTSVLIQGVECGFVNVPLHNIYLSSDLVNGPVTVHGDPTDMRESTSVFQIRTINRSKLDKRQVSVIDSQRK